MTASDNEEAHIEASRAPLLDHLIELRQRLIVCAVALVVGFIGCFIFSKPLISFLLHPLTAAYSRKHEFEADAYAAQQTDARDLSSALVKMYQDNAATLTPDPLYSTFYDSHPPALVRINKLRHQE